MQRRQHDRRCATIYTMAWLVGVLVSILCNMVSVADHATQMAISILLPIYFVFLSELATDFYVKADEEDLLARPCKPELFKFISLILANVLLTVVCGVVEIVLNYKYENCELLKVLMLVLILIFMLMVKFQTQLFHINPARYFVDRVQRQSRNVEL